MIAKAREQRAEIKADLQEALTEESKQKNELVRRKSSLFRWFYKRRITELETELPLTPLEKPTSYGWFFYACLLHGKLRGKTALPVPTPELRTFAIVSKDLPEHLVLEYKNRQ
ncbi:hypothetical protein D2912_24950 [Klebsiella pneumoniae]|nr:hypothetical protein [Klebsiella pneumoniae]MBW6047788.1 hypothetical protein [Klebsiella pneumoniae]MBX4579573.1 hypothetical protein [Klebsiella pneumoniae]